MLKICSNSLFYTSSYVDAETVFEGDIFYSRLKCLKLSILPYFKNSLDSHGDTHHNPSTQKPKAGRSPEFEISLCCIRE